MENTVQLKTGSLRIKADRRRDRCESMGLPRYSLGEEIFSSVSHGASALLAVAALVLLLVFCERTPVKIVSAAIYGGTMVALYAVSCIYHGLGLCRAKLVFRSLDHCTIFLLIAGTYTPVTLVGLGGATGWAMLIGVWAAAVVGATLNAISVERFKKASMACYLCMGWVVVLAMGTLRANISDLGFWCLLGGGVLYTLGAVLYGVGKRVPYMHSVFHLFVLMGSALHAVSVYQLVK